MFLRYHGRLISCREKNKLTVPRVRAPTRRRARTGWVVAMRVETARALAAAVLCGCSSALSSPSATRARPGDVRTLIAPPASRRVSQRQTGTCSPASKHNHGRSEADPARASPLQLFGLGGGESSSTSRSSTGAGSKARRAVEANSAFRSRMAKVRMRDASPVPS